MSEANDRPVDGAYALGIEMLDRGEPAAAVEQKLIGMGVTPDAAKKIISSYSQATVQAATSDGKLEMQLGAVVVAVAVLNLLYSGVGSLFDWVVLVIGLFTVYHGWSKRRS
jgi:hypothetical protein